MEEQAEERVADGVVTARTCQECGVGVEEGVAVCVQCLASRGHGQSTLCSPPKPAKRQGRGRRYAPPAIERTEPLRVAVDVPKGPASGVSTRIYAREGRLVFEFTLPCENQELSTAEQKNLLDTLEGLIQAVRVRG
jgi:hypothetical protein